MKPLLSSFYIEESKNKQLNEYSYNGAFVKHKESESNKTAYVVGNNILQYYMICMRGIHSPNGNQ